MKKKIAIYWKCQITGWIIYSILLFVFGLALGGFSITTLLKAVSQFAVAGIISSHLMRVVLLRMQVLQKPLRVQPLYFFSTTLCFSILIVSLFYLIELIKGFYKINMNAYSVFFVRTCIAFVSLLIWNLIYFVYQYIERIRKEEKNKAIVQLEQLESEKKIAAMGQKAAELLQQKTELEIKALRAQMNPHFIFNSLNSINRFILQNDKSKASEYLTKFSRLVRLILQNSQAAFIPLESELEALQLYLELEGVRFDHHFEYKIIIDGDLDIDLLKVPPLIIQPYAENAIWHGLMHKEERGHLEIELFQYDNVLCCKITDDGIGRQKATELKSKSRSTHKSMGMRITAERIAMLQQEKQLDATIEIIDLVLPDGSVGGTEVLLKIPVML